MKFKDLINDTTIDIWFSWNFMKNIIKTCNPTIKFLKFTSNKNNIKGV